MIAKTLSGEFITLEVSDEKEFEVEFKKKYIKKKFHPFVKVMLMDMMDTNENKEYKVMVVNVHKLLPFMEDKDIDWKYLAENEHPEAVKMCIEELKKDNYNVDLFDIVTKDSAFEYISTLIDEAIKEKYNIDLNYMTHLATNTNTRVLELLFKFENRFVDEPEVWYELLQNNNPFAFRKILEKMEKDKHFRESYDFIDNLCYVENGEVIEFLKANPKYINYKILSVNSYAVDLLLDNKDKIDWDNFSRNTSSKAIQFLRENKEKISMINLGFNHSEEGIKLFEELIGNDFYKYHKYYYVLARNPFAINLVCNVYDTSYLSTNIKILWKNPGIFCPPYGHEYEDKSIYLDNL